MHKLWSYNKLICPITYILYSQWNLIIHNKRLRVYLGSTYFTKIKFFLTESSVDKSKNYLK